MNSRVQQFITTYSLFQDDEIQQIQLAHRFSLVDAFKVKPGMRILEIGCGQGDTTLALADAVGETGHITAIDIAPGDYGAPFTLAQAHERILSSSLGSRILFHLETDFLTFEDENHYDAIVLSHCSWYFKTKEQLNAYFKKMQQQTDHVFFAEWDLAFETLNQRSHFCAVSILALYSEFVENEGNIQNVFGREQIQAIAASAGFTTAHVDTVDASFLQDGSWEVAYANHIRPELSAAPPSIQALVNTYYEVMNASSEVRSLNSFILHFTK